MLKIMGTLAAYPMTMVYMRPLYAANHFTSKQVPMELLEEKNDRDFGNLMNEVATKIHIMESCEALA